MWRQLEARRVLARRKALALFCSVIAEAQTAGDCPALDHAVEIRVLQIAARNMGRAMYTDDREI